MAKEPSHATRLVDMMQADAGDTPPASRRRAAPEPCVDETATPKRHRAGIAEETESRDPQDEAVKRALSILEYGDNSRKRLIRKLTERGFDEEIAESAVARLVEMGYLREHDACARRAEQGVRKGWGKRRIAQDLYAQRYDRETVETVMCELEDEVDFTENCIGVIRKKFRVVPEDRDARRKMAAALMRMGYGSDEVRHAMQTVSSEDEG